MNMFMTASSTWNILLVVLQHCQWTGLQMKTFLDFAAKFVKTLTLRENMPILVITRTTDVPHATGGTQYCVCGCGHA
jgi:hypothetical protein